MQRSGTIRIPKRTDSSKDNMSGTGSGSMSPNVKARGENAGERSKSMKT